jgi:hypothetical protein
MLDPELLGYDVRIVVVTEALEIPTVCTPWPEADGSRLLLQPINARTHTHTSIFSPYKMFRLCQKHIQQKTHRSKHNNR